MTVDLRLAIPAAAAWVAAAVVIADPRPAAALALWATAGLLVACAVRWPRIAIAVVAVAAAALVATSAALHAPGRSPASLESATAEGRVLTLSAIVTGSDPLALDAGGVPLLAFGPHEALAIGTTVQVRGEVGPADPGDRVAYLLYLEGAPEVTSPPIALLEATEELRAGFRQATAGLPGRGGDLLTGLAIGDTASVDDSLDAAMKASSLSHLTAVSGANCAIVVGLVLGLGVLLRMPRPARIVLALIALAGFVLLVTPEPSVLRAAVMAAIVLAALANGRPVRGLPVLALATIVLLTIDPWLAREYGFVLSVLATGGLLLLAGPIASRLERWLPRWLALVIAVPVAAQLACQPVLVLLDASLPTYGIIANVLAAPAAPIATIVGLAACLVLPIVPPLGVLLCQLAWLPSAWIAAVAQVFAAAPGARLPWPEGLLGVVLLAALTAVVVLAVVLRRRWPRAVLAGALACWLGIAAGGALIERLGRPADWQVAQCDVGQGDAVVVRSAGEVALVDTGAEPELMRECLAELGIGRLDLLVLTHYDLDHVGGASALVGRVDHVIVGPSGEAADDAMREAFVAGGARVDQVSREQAGLLGELRWRVLWPPVRLAGIEPGNPASIVLEVRGVGPCERGCLSLLMLGDLGRSGQDRLLSTAPLEPVDIVKVSHHGSADQSADLYARASATLGLIGVGLDNGYGHPTEELLDILANVGTTPARSDELGLVLVSPGSAPGTVRVWSQR